MHLGKQRGYPIAHEYFHFHIFGTTRWAVHLLMGAFIFVDLWIPVYIDMQVMFLFYSYEL